MDDDAPPRRTLVVNADDYGLTERVSEAILEAHREGVVTSTSVLCVAPGFEASAAWLRDESRLGKGLHLAVVGEDPPLLSAAEIPTLVDRRGHLHMSWRTFLAAVAAHRIDPDDLRREFAAQAAKIGEAGITVDHIDTHQNLHLWPSVRDVVMEIGEQMSVRTIRVTRSTSRGPVGAVVRYLSKRLERACDRSGWAYPVASTGLDEAGGLDEARMLASIEALASSGAASAELATHPGKADDPDLARYQWGYMWQREFEALRSRAVREAIDSSGFTLGTFGDLTSMNRGSR